MAKTIKIPTFLYAHVYEIKKGVSSIEERMMISESRNLALMSALLLDSQVTTLGEFPIFLEP